MRFPHPSLPVSWKYALGQFILVVASVLAALAANSWREGRQEQQVESARKAPPFSAWESRFPIKWEALLRDGEFRSAVDASRMIAYSRRYFYEDMRDEVHEVRRMLEAELGESAPEP